MNDNFLIVIIITVIDVNFVIDNKQVEGWRGIKNACTKLTWIIAIMVPAFKVVLVQNIELLLMALVLMKINVVASLNKAKQFRNIYIYFFFLERRQCIPIMKFINKITSFYDYLNS